MTRIRKSTIAVADTITKTAREIGVVRHTSRLVENRFLNRQQLRMTYVFATGADVEKFAKYVRSLKISDNVVIQAVVDYPYPDGNVRVITYVSNKR